MVLGKILVAFCRGSPKWIYFVFSFFLGDRKDRGCILLGLCPLEAFHFIRVIAISHFFGVIEQFVVVFYWGSTQYMCFVLPG